MVPAESGSVCSDSSGESNPRSRHSWTLFNSPQWSFKDTLLGSFQSRLLPVPFPESVSDPFSGFVWCSPRFTMSYSPEPRPGLFLCFSLTYSVGSFLSPSLNGSPFPSWVRSLWTCYGFSRDLHSPTRLGSPGQGHHSKHLPNDERDGTGRPSVWSLESRGGGRNPYIQSNSWSF